MDTLDPVSWERMNLLKADLKRRILKLIEEVEGKLAVAQSSLAGAQEELRTAPVFFQQDSETVSLDEFDESFYDGTANNQDAQQDAAKRVAEAKIFLQESLYESLWEYEGALSRGCAQLGLEPIYTLKLPDFEQALDPYRWFVSVELSIREFDSNEVLHTNLYSSKFEAVLKPRMLRFLSFLETYAPQSIPEYNQAKPPALENAEADSVAGQVPLAGAIKEATTMNAGEDGSGTAEQRPDDDTLQDSSTGTDNVFRREGKGYLIKYDNARVYMGNSKGARAVCFLLNHPEEDFSAMDIEMEVHPLPPAETISDELEVSGRLAIDDFCDTLTVAQVKKEIEYINEKLEAPGIELEEKDELEEKKKVIEKYLASNLDVYGRPRTSPDHKERAARRVTTSLRRFYKELSPHLPTLAEHLKASIVHESSCFTYRPKPRKVWCVD